MLVKKTITYQIHSEDHLGDLNFVWLDQHFNSCSYHWQDKGYSLTSAYRMLLHLMTNALKKKALCGLSFDFDPLKGRDFTDHLGDNFLMETSNNLSKHYVDFFHLLPGNRSLNLEHTTMDSRWNHTVMNRSNKRAQTALNHVLSLSCLYWGGPARGTEIATIRLTNSTTGEGIRNVFWYKGTLCFITTYKSQVQMEKVNRIVRFVQSAVAELWLQCLVWVRPVEM
ncbi:hypothetical protein BT69DRAFT_994783 [Atractiella rhizophila]|nr:hypothetical protein BT69DRAFT_994783 [Atractiella rhizophila]